MKGGRGQGGGWRRGVVGAERGMESVHQGQAEAMVKVVVVGKVRTEGEAWEEVTKGEMQGVTLTIKVLTHEYV